MGLQVSLGCSRGKQETPFHGLRKNRALPSVTAQCEVGGFNTRDWKTLHGWHWCAHSSGAFLAPEAAVAIGAREGGRRDTRSAPPIYLPKRFGDRHRQGMSGRRHPMQGYSSGYRDICPQKMLLAYPWHQQILPGA